MQRLTISDIPGLVYYKEWLRQETHDRLLEVIDRQPWRRDLARRVQHYGYVYDYRARRVDESLYIGPLPEWLWPFAAELRRRGYFAETPSQAIVNEYLPGQGIGAHTDLAAFGPVVASLTLAAATTMQLARRGRTHELRLEPRSLLLLADESRTHWTHCILPRTSDLVDGRAVTRARRVSVTFRTVRVARRAAVTRTPTAAIERENR